MAKNLVVFKEDFAKLKNSGVKYEVTRQIEDISIVRIESPETIKG